MKNILLLLLLFISVNVVAQKKTTILKATSIVEDIYYHELYIGKKTYSKLKVNYDKNSNQLTLEFESQLKNKEITKYSFFRDDLDKKSMKIFVLNMEDIDTELKHQEHITFEISTKDISIKKTEISFIDNIPLSSTKYVKTIKIGNLNNLPSSISSKYILNLGILFDVRSSKEITFYLFNKEAEEYISLKKGDN